MLTKYILIFFLVFLISVLFHATLQYEHQMWDEVKHVFLVYC
jgi:hypothetical protein